MSGHYREVKLDPVYVYVVAAKVALGSEINAAPAQAMTRFILPPHFQ